MNNSDRLLFVELAITHMDSLYTNAIRLTRSAIGAEYLVQKTYTYAYYFFTEFDTNSNFCEWINEILILVYKNDHPSIHEQEYVNSVQICV